MAELSHVEKIKGESRHLRGTLAESLRDDLTGAIREDDTVLIKFHGTYQQDDRDIRDERRRQKLEPAYSFMIRTRLPGGVCTPQQWLQLDDIARRYGNGTLRITTRQAFQFHGVVKTELKTTMQAINAALIDTIAACGDVNRNVLASANPVETRAHPVVHEWAKRLSEHLLPKTKAYHEIWPVTETAEGAPTTAYDVVGPICESGDTFTTGRALSALKQGDLIAFMTAGAYGASMSSTYNQRLLVAEVMVKGDQYAVTRPRQSYEDLIGTDRLPGWFG